MKKAAFIVLTLTILACQEDYYPPGLYGYQVERLLTTGDTGIWVLSGYQVNGQSQDLTSCQDMIQLHFLERSGNEPISVYEVTTCEVPDTVFYGAMRASSAAGSAANQNIFTDSLVFEDGAVNYLIVNDISSERLQFERLVNQERRTYLFVSGD